MNKEELEKEAEVFATYYESLFPNEFETFYKAFLKVAEPREKQIQIDAEQIRALQKQNGELTDKVKELEAQIEKMKCCANCKKYWCMCEYGDREMQICDKWEIKEK